MRFRHFFVRLVGAHLEEGPAGSDTKSPTRPSAYIYTRVHTSTQKSTWAVFKTDSAFDAQCRDIVFCLRPQKEQVDIYIKQEPEETGQSVDFA